MSGKLLRIGAHTHTPYIGQPSLVGYELVSGKNNKDIGRRICDCAHVRPGNSISICNVCVCVCVLGCGRGRCPSVHQAPDFLCAFACVCVFTACFRSRTCLCAAHLGLFSVNFP